MINVCLPNIIDYDSVHYTSPGSVYDINDDDGRIHF